MMKFAGFTASVLAFAAASAALAGDDSIVTKKLDLEGFDRIDVSGVYELDVRVGPSFSIELSGRGHEMNRVEASVKNGVLHLDQRDETRKEKRMWRNNKGIDAVITLPALNGLEVSGVVEGSISDIDSADFEVNISGVGDIELDGECGRFDAHVSGVGDLDADALECSVVNITLSGVGDASVYAREEVDARVSGMGDIDVYGSPPKVSKSKSMFADVTIH